MFKKWLNILLCIWLINSVTYFHAANPFDYNTDDQSPAAIHPKLNTWADCLLHQSPVDDECTPMLPHKIGSHRRYVNSRNHHLGTQLLSVIPSALFAFPKKLLLNCNSNYRIGVAMLPGYYNFLFRLCPF